MPKSETIESWWNGDVLRMLWVCGGFGLALFIVAALGLRRRDYAL